MTDTHKIRLLTAQDRRALMMKFVWELKSIDASWTRALIQQFVVQKTKTSSRAAFSQSD